MTVKELRASAALCRVYAAKLSGAEHHRELQRAQALEAEANERDYYRNSMTKLKEAARG